MTRKPDASLSEIADRAAELIELRASADDILGHAWAVERTRLLLGGADPAFDDQLWSTLADLGWPDVLVAEDDGGGGGGLRELCVLAEAAGAVALPAPLASAAAAAWCMKRCTGRHVTLLLEDTGATLDDVGVTGRWPIVAYAGVAAKVVLLAHRGHEAVLGWVDLNGDGVEREPLTPLDHNPAAAVVLNQAPLTVLATGDGATDRHKAAMFRARLAAVAELIGTASAANDAAIAYAKVRVTFGRPIGTRQAIKHRLVDQRSTIEVARALVNRAADACEHDSADTEALVSLSVFWALDSLRGVPEGATQVFGGIAYTWEHDAHVHLRRAATAAAALGSRADHRARVAQWLSAR